MPNATKDDLGEKVLCSIVELSVLLVSLCGIQVQIELDDDDAVLRFLERPPPPEAGLLRSKSIGYLITQFFALVPKSDFYN